MPVNSANGEVIASFSSPALAASSLIPCSAFFKPAVNSSLVALRMMLMLPTVAMPLLRQSRKNRHHLGRDLFISQRRCFLGLAPAQQEIGHGKCVGRSRVAVNVGQYGIQVGKQIIEPPLSDRLKRIDRFPLAQFFAVYARQQLPNRTAQMPGQAEIESSLRPG
jgi:hypothetical protein